MDPVNVQAKLSP